MRSVAVCFALSLMLFTGRAALASHYAVGDIPRLITPTEAEKLQKAGVNTTDQLLEKAAKAKDRKALAKASGLGASALLGLAHRCDLLRLKGVGSEMVLLFEATGVKTTTDLATKDPAALTTAIETANQSKKISEKPPVEAQLKYWIEESKKLPPLVDAK